MVPSLVDIFLDMTFIGFMNFLVMFVFFVLVYWGTYVALPEYYTIIDNSKAENPLIYVYSGIDRFFNAFVPVLFIVVNVALLS